LHGHFTLAYRILKRWERETGTPLDFILQVGDLGAYPPPFRLDDATRRFAEKDPDELGFAQYFEGSPEADEILGPEALENRRVDAEMIFIRGNHEDFSFLAETAVPGSPPTPVDAYGKVLYVPNGSVFTLEKRGHTVAIGCLGGIADRGEPGSSSVSPFYTRNELRHLLGSQTLIDVLLTHEPPLGAARVIHPKFESSGSPDVARLIQDLRPAFHFCGHYHEPGQRLDVPGPTESYILNAVGFWKPHRLNPGCIGILHWGDVGDRRFELLDAPWVTEYTKATFRDHA
jgi:hypothetical protein